jgi:hypothetical protein
MVDSLPLPASSSFMILVGRIIDASVTGPLVAWQEGEHCFLEAGVGWS